MRFAMVLGLLALFLPGAARAEWLQASSAHFVIYADSNQREIRRFAEQLERYHAAMAYIMQAAPEAPSPSNRVTVFIVGGERQVRNLYGEGSRFVRGFYIPRAGASVAVVPRVTGNGNKPTESMIVLLHEYAHHFLYSISPFPMPRWQSEGMAEFMASASFDADGTVEIGKPAHHRSAELLVPGFARAVKVADLVDPAVYEKRRGGGYDAFYGKSWLLFHYLTFEKSRAGQLDRYSQLMARGKSSRDAAVEAFGDLGQLESEVDRYSDSRRMLMLKLPPDRLHVGQVAVRRLSAGEAAIMSVRIRSQLGVDEAQAKRLVIEARAIAARFPDDPAVQAALAEAEHDAGNDREAVAAAEAALARDRGQVNAHVQKGLALLRLAADAAPGDQAAAYARARGAFLELNHMENDHPLPLTYNYRIVVEQGRTPDAQALRGLERAAELAPFDLGLKMNLALQQLRFGKRDDARRNLAPVAHNPHPGPLARAAQEVLARMDSDPKWDGGGFAAPSAIDADDADGNERPAG